MGNYELVDRFAVGGVAEIFRARDVRTGGLVVIKRMRPDADFDPDLTAGFLREIQLALLSTHDNLVRGLERGSAGGLDYVVLEYVDGVDLARVVARAKERRAAIPLEAAAWIVCSALDGLHFAHELVDERGRRMGLVHRDVAPKNLFVRYDGRVCVGDFGASIAAALEPAPTEIVGTPGYLSPEQAALAPLDRRSDVFAIGCVLHELVGGQPAFDVDGKKDAAILKAHQKGALRPLPKSASVPDGVRLVVETATAVAPAGRYATAAAMRDALARAVDLRPSAQASVAALVRGLFSDEYARTRDALQGHAS